ncbi:MAG: electron transfer flavoprotein alpha subunit [Lentisphaeria bacterium]|jgi:electron transfer flavoprotein alpha subunit
MKILLLAQHDNSTLHPATLNVIAAASKLGDHVVALVAGCECSAVAQQVCALPGVRRVLLADNECYRHMLAENVAGLIADIAASYSHVLGPANTFGKNILPRVGALLDVQAITDVLAIESSDTFRRPIYAGNLIARVRSEDKIIVMTVRTTAFDSCIDRGTTERACDIEEVSFIARQNYSKLLNRDLVETNRPELDAARVVVSGGRALGSEENFDILYSLADKLNGAVGASRAAVDAGYVSNELQVGQTGRIVAPELYFAIGLSGAIQHIAGMKDSKVIVAINKDPDAPIFDIADYGLVADLFDAVPELDALVC